MVGDNRLEDFFIQTATVVFHQLLKGLRLRNQSGDVLRGIASKFSDLNLTVADSNEASDHMMPPAHSFDWMLVAIASAMESKASVIGWRKLSHITAELIQQRSVYIEAIVFWNEEFWSAHEGRQGAHGMGRAGVPTTAWRTWRADATHWLCAPIP